MAFPEHPTDNEFLQPRILLTEQDVRDAARLLRRLSEAIARPPGESLEASREELIGRARLVLQARQQRYRYFNRAMFGEPAWDVLLLLYATERSEGRQSIGRIAEWIDTPVTTAARWIDYLEKERLVGRQTHPNDKRVNFIHLLDKGRNLIDSYLSGISMAST